MPSRESLSNFAEGLSRIVSPAMVQVEYEEPIDPSSVCLNKIKKRKRLASFLTNTDMGDMAFRKFFSEKSRDPNYKEPPRTNHWGEIMKSSSDDVSKVDNVISIRAIVAPGTIRIPNKKYRQNQAGTVEAFDMHFDMIPLNEEKKAKQSQMVVIKELTFKRFSDITSPRIPTEALEKRWNETNKDRTEAGPVIKTPRILRLLPGDRIRNSQRVLPF